MIDNLRKYGIDAPNIVRNLMIFGGLALLLLSCTFLIQDRIWFSITFSYSFLISSSLLMMSGFMLYSSIKLKPKILSRVIKELQLKEDAHLLDLGCGRGIFLIEAAKHLPQGKAVGVDLWRAVDQSANRKDQTMKNIRSEVLTTQIEIHTADICSLPFPDNSFDAVISSLAIHNISDPKKQEMALDELLRVLKPNGQFAIFDILSVKRYRNYLHSKGVLLKNKKVFYCPKGVLLTGKNNQKKEYL